MDLTRRQREVLEFIRDFILRRGGSPTVREVAEHFGFRSPLAAKQHIDALVRKGYLKRRPFLSRGLEMSVPVPFEAVRLPVAGRIRAGEPLLASEDVEEYLSVDRTMVRTERCFGLRVVGDSMKGAGILEGDIVLVAPEVEVRSGDIVVALIGEEATVKRFYRKGETIRLQPEHPDLEPIILPGHEVVITGKVVGLMRRF